jgi:hypothetical protein
MVARCLTPTNKDYLRYGGRGIAVCERWRTFEEFLADMGECPMGMTLDRESPLGNYEPSNCRWATRKQQSENQTRVTWIEARGQRLTLCQWAVVIGVSHTTMLRRFKIGNRGDLLLRAPRHGLQT